MKLWQAYLNFLNSKNTLCSKTPGGKRSWGEHSRLTRLGVDYLILCSFTFISVKDSAYMQETSLFTEFLFFSIMNVIP